MAHIEFRKLGHAYSGAPAKLADYALQPMSMDWRDGGAYALLGPSGCGKSTLLNIISGLLIPSEGQVLFNGEDVTNTPTRGRNIAQVFQFPVLYDSMSVEDNLAFPLRNRKMAESEVKKRVQEVAEMLDLTQDLKKRASGLAADAKQKISLGRGLVRKDVAAILFDEPLTVIDPHMKWQLRQKLKQMPPRQWPLRPLTPRPPRRVWRTGKRPRFFFFKKPIKISPKRPQSKRAKKLGKTA